MYTSIKLGKTRADIIDRKSTISFIKDWIESNKPAAIVVTPNLAQVAQAEYVEELKDVFKVAALATPDGWPILLAAKLLHPKLLFKKLERVAGSDLLPALAASTNFPIALVGGRDNNSNVAAQKLTEKYNANISSIEPVPLGELDDAERRSELIVRIVESRAQLVFLGLGVPKQEALALQLKEAMPAGLIFCVGASIDFAAGSIRRAPKIAQKLGLEWAYRIALEPKRMFGRYFRSVWPFTQILFTEAWFKVRSNSR